MAYSDTIPFVQGDDLPTITAYIRDKNTAASGRILDSEDEATWAPVPLANTVLTVAVREVGGVEVIDSFPAAIIDIETSRILLVIPPSAAFAQVAGTYEAEITITFQGGLQQTIYDWLKFKVRERF